MAREFKLLAVLWLVAACLVSGGASPTSAADPTTAPPSPTTPAADPTTTPAADPTTTPAADPTTAPPSPTTPAADPTTTPAADPTTTPAADPTTAPPSPTTPAADPTTTPAADPTTTPAADPTTTPAADPTTAPPRPTTPAATGPSTTPPRPTTPAATGPSTTPPRPTTPAATGPSTTPPRPTTPAATGPSTTPPRPTTPAATGPSTTPPPSTTAGKSTTPQQSTTSMPDPCEVEPCGDGSTCQAYAGQAFVCLCLAGDDYNPNSKSCENAKVFPGQLHLPELEYKANMNDKMSTEFLDTWLKIDDALITVFKGSGGYHTSMVLELRSITNSKVWSRSKNGVNATVEIIFTGSASITTADVTKMINENTCKNCLLAKASFQETKLCEKNPCDKNTTECLSGDGSYNCTCMENYIKTDFSRRICLACPSGQKAEGSDGCVNCPFGYSGLNCNESWQLALVIVGSVFGGLLLITLILLPIVARKSSKKSSKKNKNADIGKPYVSHSPAKAPLVNGSFAKSQAAPVNGSANGLAAFANAGVPKIPRATTTSSWDSRTNLEMTPSNSRQNLVPVGRNSRLYEDQDDMNSYAQSRPQSSLYAQSRPQSSLYAQARPQSSLYAQARPQNNPYAQNRPQTNPYASSQGQTNPYYMHDDGRQFN